jgi:hypothetical protein
MRITQVGSGKGVVVVYYEGDTASGSFRDLTILCENFSLPATSQRPPAPTRTLCFCVGSAESELRRPRVRSRHHVQVRSRHHVQVRSPISTAS